MIYQQIILIEGNKPWWNLDLSLGGNLFEMSTAINAFDFEGNGVKVFQ